MSTTTPSFTMKASNTEGGDFELPPSGIHPAVLIGLIDLGTQAGDYKGTPYERRKICCVWELTAESDSKGNNFVVMQDYTWSLGKKAKFRNICQGFRGKDFGDGEEFDPSLMLGKPIVISLAEGISGSGKTFVEVVSIAQPMRGMTVPPPTHEIVAFHLSTIEDKEQTLDIPDWIPLLYGRKVEDDIRNSKEYKLLPDSVPF